MRIVLMACIFGAGVYLGLHADVDGEIVHTVEQIEGIIASLQE
jgi:hypothetical protein